MLTTLYLVRHAIAELQSPTTSDADRPLTADGAAKMQLAALGLKRLGVQAEVILSSPLLRARHTAALLCDALAPNLSVSLYAPLGPGGSIRELLQGLRDQKAASHVFLVGHEPDMGLLASQLLDAHARGSLPFKKGSVAAIEIASLATPSSGQLQWFLNSKQLRLLGGAND